MTLPAFDLHRASSIDEASDLLGRYGDDAAAIAGGTELLLVLKFGFSACDQLVDVRGIPELAGIRVVDGVLEIGAAVTHRELERSGLVQEQIPALAEMERVGRQHPRAHGGHARRQPLLRRSALRPGDVPAGGGRRRRTAPWQRSGSRPAAAASSCSARTETALNEGDLLVSIRVPATTAGTGIAHRKLAFRERPAATVAVWVRVADGSVAEARIAVGSVGPLAVRATEAESLLLGRRPCGGGRRRGGRGIGGRAATRTARWSTSTSSCACSWAAPLRTRCSRPRKSAFRYVLTLLRREIVTEWCS